MDGLRRRTIDRHASAGKVRFFFWGGGMLSTTPTTKPMTLKISTCHVELVLSNCDKFRAIRRRRRAVRK